MPIPLLALAGAAVGSSVIGGIAGAVIGGALGGGLGAELSGQKFAKGAIAGALGGLAGPVTGAISGALAPAVGETAANIISKGLFGAASAAATGGDPKIGALAGALGGPTGLVSEALKFAGASDDLTRLLSPAVTGGIISTAAGGDFSTGALLALPQTLGSLLFSNSSLSNLFGGASSGVTPSTTPDNYFSGKLADVLAYDAATFGSPSNYFSGNLADILAHDFAVFGKNVPYPIYEDVSYLASSPAYSAVTNLFNTPVNYFSGNVADIANFDRNIFNYVPEYFPSGSFSLEPTMWDNLFSDSFYFSGDPSAIAAYDAAIFGNPSNYFSGNLADIGAFDLSVFGTIPSYTYATDPFGIMPFNYFSGSLADILAHDAAVFGDPNNYFSGNLADIAAFDIANFGSIPDGGYTYMTDPFSGLQYIIPSQLAKVLAEQAIKAITGGAAPGGGGATPGGGGATPGGNIFDFIKNIFGGGNNAAPGGSSTGLPTWLPWVLGGLGIAGVLSDKDKNNTTTTTTVTTPLLPGWVDQAQQIAAQNLLNVPIQPWKYTNPLAAGLSPNEASGIQMADLTAGAWAPQFAQAVNKATRAALSLPETDLNAYMNPYIAEVLAPQIRQINQNFDKQRADLDMAAASRGAFGTSRNTLMEGLIEENRQRALSEAINKAYADAFNYATSTALQDRSGILNAAGTLGNMAQAYQNMLGQDIQQLMNTGAVARTVQDTLYQRMYNDYLNQIGYPLQALQTQASGLSSVFPRVAGSSNQTVATGPAPNMWSNLFGTLATGAGLLKNLGYFNQAPAAQQPQTQIPAVTQQQLEQMFTTQLQPYFGWGA